MFGTIGIHVGGGGNTPRETAGGDSRDQARELDPIDDDLRRLRAGIDGLESEFSAMARRVQRRGDHLVNGNITAAS
jgi:hypothetical protein